MPRRNDSRTFQGSSGNANAGSLTVCLSAFSKSRRICFEWPTDVLSLTRKATMVTPASARAILDTSLLPSHLILFNLGSISNPSRKRERPRLGDIPPDAPVVKS